MNTIHKQILQIEGMQQIQIPCDAKILHVNLQNGEICVWYLCDPELPMSVRYISMFGTGHPIPPIKVERRYLGTVHLAGDQLVLHVFEEG